MFFSVRLGEFDNSQRTKTDCVDVPLYNTTECSTSEDYEIEERILHPFRVGFTYNNDIALLRLNKNVHFTGDY